MVWAKITKLWPRPSEEKLLFSLDGFEMVRYGETEQVIDKLSAVGAALALFHIKGADRPADTEHQWMYDFTDGMTEEQVRQASDATVSLIETLNQPQENAWHSEGTLTLSDAGALMQTHGQEIGFPFQGAKMQMSQGWLQRRFAKQTGANLILGIRVEGGDDIFSDCSWNIDRDTCTIEYALVEARREKIKDYGFVLLNQEIKAVGKIEALAHPAPPKLR
jgi:hypothetical protein